MRRKTWLLTTMIDDSRKLWFSDLAAGGALVFDLEHAMEFASHEFAAAYAEELSRLNPESSELIRMLAPEEKVYQ